MTRNRSLCLLPTLPILIARHRGNSGAALRVLRKGALPGCLFLLQPTLMGSLCRRLSLALAVKPIGIESAPAQYAKAAKPQQQKTRVVGLALLNRIVRGG